MFSRHVQQRIILRDDMKITECDDGCGCAGNAKNMCQ